jgi:integrase
MRSTLPAGIPARCACRSSSAQGLRVAEAAALRLSDVDFMRGIITPAVQYPGVELKTEESKNPIPIPQGLRLELSKNHTNWGSETSVTNEGDDASHRTAWRPDSGSRGRR